MTVNGKCKPRSDRRKPQRGGLPQPRVKPWEPVTGEINTERIATPKPRRGALCIAPGETRGIGRKENQPRRGGLFITGSKPNVTIR